MTEQAFKYRIITQGRVYLCMDKIDLANGATGAFDVVRDRDWCNDSIPIMPEVIFKCGVIIEPIVVQPDVIGVVALERGLVQPVNEEWARMTRARDLARAQELARRG